MLWIDAIESGVIPANPQLDFTKNLTAFSTYNNLVPLYKKNNMYSN
ncbi:hypothetical protein M4I21_03655 [Cellulophaga sp. 20_2_10]|nr:hypothetical protein [Cellulophaga sp. 20_2_10]MCL5244890.1 hypothetical protein [Cellulophaga sp. 20_2_10]